MLRTAFLSPLLVLGLQLAQAQIFPSGPPASALSPTHGQISGPPASALSPTPDGRLHGVPASALSLKPVPPGVNRPGHVFLGNDPHRPFRSFDPHHRRRIIVPVPLFYPAYGGDYTSEAIADPNVADAADQPQADDAATASNEDALRQAYLQGAHDALRNELDSAQAQQKPAAPARSPFKKPPDETEAPQQSDDSPATVFIFKDGHQLETKNYAIMGQTLYDLSGSSVKKVPLNDLDSAATQKANDDRGIQVKLP